MVFPVAGSQILVVLSIPPLASLVPSWFQATLIVVPWWPSKTLAGSWPGADERLERQRR
jgi:hypothetical protein